MGANQSNSQDYGFPNSSLENNITKKHEATSRMMIKEKGFEQGKPNPPSGAPVATDITHNSLMLSWQPPKLTSAGSIIAYTIKMKDLRTHEWITLTKSCQGNNYLVKNLEPNSSYQFRVLAENVHGRSKPGRCSEVVQTNNLNFQKVPSPLMDRKSPSLMRRHSVNIHVEGTVANILNHTDPVVKTSASSSALNNGTFQRDTCYRNSLQTGRKRSMNSILPGTKTDSLLRLKDSLAKQQANSRGSSKASSEDITRSCSHESSIDRIENESNTDDQSVISDNFVRDVISQNGNVDEVDNCEKTLFNNSDTVSSARAKIHNQTEISGQKFESGSNDEDSSFESSQQDFRTLRNMLNSSDIIIKSSRSLPEISDIYKTNLTHTTLSTIVDEDSDDDAVQVSTL